MSEWPEALIEKIAEAIEESDVTSPVSYRRNAVAALDALGLREEYQALGVRSGGSLMVAGPFSESPDSLFEHEIGYHTRQFRFVTPWEDA